MKIEELRDFSALRQIERALWKQGRTRGAAVFVGAGFSRNAQLIHEGATAPPLWNDLARAMEERIESSAARPSRDPLRTAEEFRAVLGQPALEGLIRELVLDDQWLPGLLHQKLVALPWVDILTTNWDTLLERAASTTLGQNFEVVRCLEDIAATRAPRIIKLHGSLPSNRPFIVSEEDYRTYPQNFAPFVNLVQQVLLENELCLLGFSGDDPNFLKWTGWIRDQLGVSARRIYLVGALDLGTAQRKLLEQRNICPVDLSPLVGHREVRHRQTAAAEIFLEHLSANRPQPKWDWDPNKSAPSWAYGAELNQVAEALKNLTQAWTSIRQSYPGWAICPLDLQRSIRHNTYYALHNAQALAAMEPKNRADLCYEAAWRLETALLPVANWEALFTECVEDRSAWNDPNQRDYVISLLLRNAREARDEPAFEKWSLELQGRADSNLVAASALAYERCLWARDAFDFTSLSALISTLSGADPLWNLRRACLFSELGEFDTARTEIGKTLAKTRGLFARDRNSIWALSRLAWTQFCARSLRDWNDLTIAEDDAEAISSLLHETKCDPWEVIHAIDREIEDSLRRYGDTSPRIEPQFDPGTYRDHGGTLTFGASPDLVNYKIVRLSDCAGVPWRTNSSSILSHRMSQGEPLESYENDSDFLQLLRVVQGDQKAPLVKRFGRIEVANFTLDRVTFLQEVLSRALEYALAQLSEDQNVFDQIWRTRAAIYTEILSRLVVRMEPAQALEWFQKSLDFSKDSRWHFDELFESLGHLAERSISAVPPNKRTALLTEVMNFPLISKLASDHPLQRKWPSSWGWIEDTLMERPVPDDDFKSRTCFFIERVRNDKGQERNRAVFWLLTLQMRGILTLQESREFGDALWAQRASDEEFPSGTDLRSHMFLLLPSPEEHQARKIFKRQGQILSASRLIEIAGATHAGPNSQRHELFDRAEARVEFDRIVAWKPRTMPGPDFGGEAAENARAVQAIGSALANAILPVLNVGDLAAQQIDQIFARENDALSIVQTYPELVRLDPSQTDRAVKGIIRATVSRDNSTAWAGFNAIFRWLRAVKNESQLELPRRLTEATISVIETRREPGLIHALNMAGHLLEESILTDNDIERLTSALGLIWIETAYDAAEGERITANTTWTLVRAKAARLALALASSSVVNPDLELWTINASGDPMPEVRFAGETHFE